jgi:2,4-dienoyl-CoA reductase (NADPH2)
VTLKISGDEYIAEGLGLREMIQIARLAGENGVDGVLISAGTVGGKKEEDLAQLHKVLRTLPMMTHPGCLVPLAAEMKRVLSIPVIAVGRISHPALAEDIIGRGQADLVALGRALLADPYFPRKAFAGKEEEIRPCIACNEGCYKRIFQQLDIRCSVNPALGREEEAPGASSPSPKRVAVIGGGPAGMEAAHAARERGHEVLLLEARQELGGQLKLASLPPGRNEIERFRRFLEDRLQKNGVKVLRNEKATAVSLQRHAPDTVILATGAHPKKINLAGLKEEQVISAWDVLEGKGEIRDPVLILGAGLVGCETADLLSEDSKRVIIAEILPEIAPGQDGDTKAYFTLKFKNNGVEVLTGVELKSVEGETAILRRGSEELRIRVGTVVCAVGAEPNDDLEKELVSSGLKVIPLTLPLSPEAEEGGVRGKVIKVGDCVQPRTILEAVREGFEVGRAV